MSNIPADLKYTKSHEWVRTLADGNVEVGITDHAQGALGDLVFVDVPESGKALKVGDAFAVVESVKAASDVYAPIAGSVIEGNAALGSTPCRTIAPASGSSASGEKSGGASTSIDPPMMGGGSCARSAATCRRSRRSWTRNKIVSTPPPNASSDDPVIAATTWILIQYEFSAGTSGAGPTYRNETAIAMVNTANMSANPPSAWIL